METNSIKKCPNCGAVINDFVIKCPECGYYFQEENQASKDGREALDQFQDKILQARTITDKVLLINTLSLPNTKEANLKLLAMSYSCYNECVKTKDDIKVSNAWFSKAIETYRILLAQNGQDIDVMKQLEPYSNLEKIQEKQLRDQRTKKRVIRSIVCLLIIVLLGGSFFIIKSISNRYNEIIESYAPEATNTFDIIHNYTDWESLSISQCEEMFNKIVSLQDSDYELLEWSKYNILDDDNYELTTNSVDGSTRIELYKNGVLAKATTTFKDSTTIVWENRFLNKYKDFFDMPNFRNTLSYQEYTSLQNITSNDPEALFKRYKFAYDHHNYGGFLTEYVEFDNSSFEANVFEDYIEYQDVSIWYRLSDGGAWTEASGKKIIRKYVKNGFDLVLTLKGLKKENFMYVFDNSEIRYTKEITSIVRIHGEPLYRFKYRSRRYCDSSGENF